MGVLNLKESFLIFLFFSPFIARGGVVPLEVDKENSRIFAQVQATGHSFDAVVEGYDLEIKWNPETRKIESGHFTFDFKEVTTGKERRDREMLDWLNYSKYPTASYHFEMIEPAGESMYKAQGTLRLHGVEHPLTVSFKKEILDSGIRIKGHTVMDHREWNLEKIRAFLIMTVDPKLDINFDILATSPDALHLIAHRPHQIPARGSAISDPPK